MASFYARPDSPPPRQPSPDILPPSLPHPPRRISSQPRIHVQPPPGLAGHERTKTLHSARSYDFLSPRTRPSTFPEDDERRSLRSGRRPSRSNLTVSPVSSPRSSPSSSVRSTPDFVPRHRRNPSVAFNLSSASSSPSPNFFKHSDTHLQAQAPPAVVSLTPYRYTGPQHIICPKPVSLTTPTIIIPDIVDVDVTPRVQQFEPETQPDMPHPISIPTQMREFKASSYKPDPVLPPLEKHKSMGIACLKFFGIRPHSSRQPSSAVVTAM